MVKPAILWLFLAALLISSGQARNDNALLTVVQPSELASMKMDATLGNFGHITYGQTIVGRVVMPTKSNNFGCEPLGDNQFEQPVDRSPNLSLFILVERGHCPNPDKVRNIQNFGAAIALIVDSKVEDMDDVVMMDFGGVGHSLITPGFMIDHNSGEEIKRFL